MAHPVGQIVSGVQVSASFHIIPWLVGQLGSEVQVSVSFLSFALKMFVCHSHNVTVPVLTVSAFGTDANIGASALGTADVPATR